jgi:putative ABC transport system ATP-binding protein
VVNQPPILFADEPTGNLDSRNSKEVMELLRSLNEEGQTIVMVTHSPENARYAHKTVHVADGMLKTAVAA